MKLAALQQAFLDDLTGAGDALATCVVDEGAITLANRLDIYRNAYNVRFVEALANDHEMLQRYIGEQAFSELVQEYVTEHPSTVPSLRFFGDQLPQFLVTNERYGGLPLLAELASFERALLDVFDAPDADHLGLDHLQNVPPDRWPEIKFSFHPSIRFFGVQHNCVEVWQAMKQEIEPPIAQSQEATWLLWRNPDRLSEFRSLSSDEAAALQLATDDSPFSEICEAMLAWLPVDQVAGRAAGLVRHWVETGLICRLDA